MMSVYNKKINKTPIAKRHINKTTLMAVLMTSSMLVGCADRVKVAEEKMQAIRNAPAQPIEPPPKAEIVEDFVYSASNLRSPFIAPSLLTAQTTPVESNGIKPDLTRPKEPLEAIELSEITYRGTVISPEGQQYGMVQIPDGSIVSVKVGDYIGVNYGRIVEITPTQINIIEIVPDSRAGFVEKPASLISPTG